MSDLELRIDNVGVPRGFPVGDQVTVQVQTVLDAPQMRRHVHLTDTDKQDVRRAVGVSVDLLAKLVGNVLLPLADALPLYLPEDTVLILIWFVPLYSDENLIALTQGLGESVRQKTILFEYAGEDPMGVLEATGVAGLVTSDAVQDWKNARPKNSFKMASGHGLYGMKRYFDINAFDVRFMTFRSSEHYMLFYNQDIHDLDRLLSMYIERLVGVSPPHGRTG